MGYPVAADIVIDAMPAQLPGIAREIAALELVSYVATSVRQGQISAQAYAATSAR